MLLTGKCFMFSAEGAPGEKTTTTVASETLFSGEWALEKGG